MPWLASAASPLVSPWGSVHRTRSAVPALLQVQVQMQEVERVAVRVRRFFPHSSIALRIVGRRQSRHRAGGCRQPRSPAVGKPVQCHRLRDWSWPARCRARSRLRSDRSGRHQAAAASARPGQVPTPAKRPRRVRVASAAVSIGWRDVPPLRHARRPGRANPAPAKVRHAGRGAPGAAPARVPRDPAMSGRVGSSIRVHSGSHARSLSMA